MLELLTSPNVLRAMLFLCVAGVFEPLLEQRVKRMFEANPVFEWSWDHLFGPMLRAAIVAGFVLLA